MYVCHCNTFNDSAVKEHLDTLDEKPKLKDVYAHCAGGRPVNCGTCIPMLKDLINEKFPDPHDKETDQAEDIEIKPCSGQCSCKPR